LEAAMMTYAVRMSTDSSFLFGVNDG